MNIVTFGSIAVSSLYTFHIEKDNKQLHPQFYCNLQRQTHSFFILYEITIRLFVTFPKAHKASVHGECRDYGSVTLDFSPLLLITCIVWLASLGKRSTRGYYAHT